MGVLSEATNRNSKNSSNDWSDDLKREAVEAANMEPEAMMPLGNTSSAFAAASAPRRDSHESDHSRESATSSGSRRDARRNKRHATRNKFRKSAGSSSAIASNTSPDFHSENDSDDGEDDVNDQIPGSFVVSGPRGGNVDGNGLPHHHARGPSTVLEDKNEDGDEEDDDTYNAKSMRNGLPVDFEAELVSDYQNVVVAQKDSSERAVPVKWILIGICLLLVIAITTSVGLAVALGGGDDNVNSGSSSSFNTDPVAASFTPNATAAPASNATYGGPVVVDVDPTTKPLPVTAVPVQAPVEVPVAVTQAPAEHGVPTNPPVEAPVQVPTESPTGEVPTNPPVKARVQVPTEPPVTVPVEAPTSIDGNVTPGLDGLFCECRYYYQELHVSDDTEYAVLNAAQLEAYLGLIVDQFSDYNPYPFSRKLMSLRGGKEQPTMQQPEHGSRSLIPTRFSFAIAIDKQVLTPAGSTPFGVAADFELVFCVDDAPFLGDYHSGGSFVSTFGSSMSLYEMTVPTHSSSRA